MTEKFCPAILTDPIRTTPAFAETVNPTVPLALPVCPDDTVIHPASLVASHGQPLIVLTSTARRPPAGPIESRERLRS